MPKRQYSQLAAAISAALLPISTWAHADPNDIYSFDAVVVTASKSAQKLGEVDGSMTLIQADTIAQQLANSVDDLFEFTPGISVSGAGNRGNSPINIRGITGNRVLVNVDGVRQPKNLNFGFLSSSRHFIDVNTLKQVEVIPGPASSLYGSDALGGVVSYTTKEAADLLPDDADGLAGNAKLGYDSSNKSWSESATLATRKGQVESLAVITHRQGHEIKNKGSQGGTGSSREQADPKDTKDLSLLGKVKIKLDAEQALKFTAEQVNNDEDIDAKSNTLANTVYQDEKSRTRVSAEYNNTKPTAAFDSLSTRLDWQKAKTNQLATYLSSERPASYDSDYDENTVALNLDLKKQLKSTHFEHQLSYGAAAERTQFTQWRNSSSTGIARGMPRSTSQSVALYAQDQISFGETGLSLTPGLRYDQYTITPKPDADYLAGNPYDRAPAKNQGNQASFKLGSTYKMDAVNSLFGQFTQGYKAPDMNQLYENFDRPGAYAGKSNPHLKPESVDSLEAGYRFQGERANVEITAFHSQYDDFIENINLGADTTHPMGIFQNQNITGVKIKGLEAKGSVDVTEQLQLRGALAYAKGTSKKEGKTQALDSVAPLHGTVALAYNAPSKQWGSELSIRAAVGKKPVDVSKATPFLPAGYGVLDATTYYKLGKNLRLDAGIFNITDKHYWEWETARNLTAAERRNSEAARHVKLGLTYDF
ncbi:TonB-dependent hemoglobin/transferrin/lactoferrin family receptor [uncultured Thiothrix sp.]|uniref:TonB-dependent hemoglobin/transferrin/lactoferrin family receptor n=1 Tax=uncultured Thiothrix sp. TaxID=223185 RepID=UPI0026059C5A|nr:TonB-dependent hemoglobin/transferrin/lactoferrin family receptor [uncultured Thiothrix sp.]